MGKKIKTILVFMLCLLCAVGACIGCDESEYDYEETALKYYGYTTNQTTSNFNKDLFYRNEVDQKMGDPTSLFITEGEWEGYIYSTGTGVGGSFTAFRTNDFVTWEDAGKIFKPSTEHFGIHSFWAPQYYWDADAKYEDYNVEKKEGEDGTGLYFLFYSAMSKSDLDFDITNKDTKDDVQPACYYPAVAVSKTPNGPFVEYEGVNKNGLEMDASTPLFNIEYIDRTLDEGVATEDKLYKTRRSFIDACPFVAPDGTKYLYLARNRVNDNSNEIWAVKMTDWVSPDYSTVTRLTSFGYTTTDKTEVYNYENYSTPIDEGPFVVYNETNKKYYLTFSLGGTKDKLYPVIQAVGDSPLGPFTKIQPEKGGVICAPTYEWDMNSSGHHSFVQIGNELYIVYHTYPVDLSTGVLGERGQSFDKVTWKENEDGLLLMHANGPTKTIQALPEYYSGYKNIASQAKVKATKAVNGSSASYLTDGLVKVHDVDTGWCNDQVKEFEASGNTIITLDFNEYVTARAIMIYNSYNYLNGFKKISKITFTYCDENGKTGLAVIKDLKYDIEGNIVPLETYYSPEELAQMTQAEKDAITIARGCGAAIAEFDELKIKSIKIEIPKAFDKLCISDIVVLGKN